MIPQIGSKAAQDATVVVRDTDFWPSLLMATALTSMTIGIIWDISWHETVGRDTFWTPAHMAIYLGGVLAGCVGGWLAIKHTFFATPVERDSSVRVFGARTLVPPNDPDLTPWRYVHVRRLVIMIEESIDQAARWLAFEPNRPE